MSGIDVKFVLTGQEALEARLRGAPLKVIEILRADLANFAQKLKVIAAGKIHSRSGRLAASIQATTTSNSRSVSVLLFTLGVPYALAQEKGATYGPRVIRPVKGQALAFTGSYGGARAGDVAFFAHVNWPGARIPAKRYALGTLRDNRAEFERLCLEAMTRAASDGS